MIWLFGASRRASRLPGWSLLTLAKEPSGDVPGKEAGGVHPVDINVRICGEAGQGVQTAGNLLLDVVVAGGLHVFGTQSYMSRVRGGANSFDVRIADVELFSAREEADLMVAFTSEALEHFRSGAGANCLVISDSDQEREGVLALPLDAAAREVGGQAVMVGSVTVGAILELLGYDHGAARELLKTRFAKKGEEVADRNVACLERGAELVESRRGSVAAPKGASGPLGRVYSGSEAVGLGGAAAGVKLVCSYPMTPSTGVFTYLAGCADRYGIVIEQAEDEISAVNMICGASYAGAPAMTTTSGGGLALMGEGLSLAGMTELPILILNSQRPGPATGLPTRTGQEDLNMAVHSGHGEFPRAVFAPGHHAQCYTLMRRALETAHRFQTPVILMIDQFLADMQKNIAALPEELKPVDRCVVLAPSQDYQRYALTEDGVSPRALPGSGPFVITDSDEHTADGHLTEDLAAHLEQQDKRLRKGRGLLEDSLDPEVYPGPAAEALLCWGSNYGPCREAVDLLRAAERDFCMIHFAQVWPLDAKRIAPLLAGRRIHVVEGNATAQLAGLLRSVGALADHSLVLRYDGLQFTGQEIAERVSQ